MGNYYSNINNDAAKHRAQLRTQIDSFASFSWNDQDMFDKYGMFIINEREGGLKMYNGPSFSNEYAKPQFSSANSILTGVNFNVQIIEFTVGVYWINMREYRQMLKEFDAYEVGNLRFDFNPEWHYQVKLKNISDSPKYVVGSRTTTKQIGTKPKDFTEHYYYTELKLSFEIQGNACAYAEPYAWYYDLEKKHWIINKNLSDNIHENDAEVRSDLDFPLDIEIPFQPLTSELAPTQGSFISRVTADGQVFEGRAYGVINMIGGNTIVFNQLVSTDKRIISPIPSSPRPVGVSVAIPNAIDKHSYFLNVVDKGFIYDRQIVRCNKEMSIDEFTGSVIGNFNSRYHIVDLTQCYGVGNEPTDINDNRINNIKALLKEKPSFVGSELVNATPTTFESFGANLCDNEWERGYIDTNGVDKYNDNSLRSKNYLRVIPNGGVLFNAFGIENGNATIRWYDKDKKYIDYSSLMNINNQSQSYNPKVPENCYYARLSIVDITNVNLNAQGVLIYSKNRNDTPTAYIPYKGKLDTVVINSKDYFSNGMNGVAVKQPNGSFTSARDLLTSKYARQVMGVVDLGTLTWKKDASYGGFWRSKFSEAKVIGNKTKPNAICTGYEVKQQYYVIDNHDTDKVISVGDKNDNLGICIYDSVKNSMSVAEFKNSLNGIMLVYELAEPIETPIEPERVLSYDGEANGIEYWDSKIGVYSEIWYYSDLHPDTTIEVKASYPQPFNPTKTVDMTLMKVTLENLTQTDTSESRTRSLGQNLQETYYLHYFSQEGIVLYNNGGNTDTLLTLLSSAGNGKRLVKTMEVNKFMLPSDYDLSNISIKVDIQNGQFISSLGTDTKTRTITTVPNILINASARTSIF